MSLTLGIDQSKRCTACVVIESDGSLEDCELICAPQGLEGYDVIDYQWDKFCLFYESLGDIVDSAAIEKLALNASGSSKDLLAGLNYGFQWQANKAYGLFLGVVPVTSWRSKVLDKDEQREAKASGKDGLKWAVFNKLPATVRKQFADVVEEAKDYILQAKDKKWKPGSKSMVYQTALWDLADAYWLARYLLTIKY